MKKKNPTLDDYIAALEKMKKSPRDRLGILGEFGVTSLGVTAGAAASGSIAAAAGVATLAGSTTLASILGGVFVTTTPLGWIVGSAVAGGALALSAGKLIRSGGKCDKYRELDIQQLESRIEMLRLEASFTSNFNDKYNKIVTSLEYLVVNSYMTPEKCTQFLTAIHEGALSVPDTFELVQNLIKEKQANIQSA